MSKINTILLANNRIGEVFNYEAGEFTNDPAVTVVPSGNTSDYNTVSENERVYAFSIKIFIKRTGTTASANMQSEADRKMRILVDSIINDFDSDYLFESLTVPTGYTFINVFAVPSAWGYAGREDDYRAAEITLECRVIVDINSI